MTAPGKLKRLLLAVFLLAACLDSCSFINEGQLEITLQIKSASFNEQTAKDAIVTGITKAYDIEPSDITDFHFGNGVLYFKIKNIGNDSVMFAGLKALLTNSSYLSVWQMYEGRDFAGYYFWINDSLKKWIAEKKYPLISKPGVPDSVAAQYPLFMLLSPNVEMPGAEFTGGETGGSKIADTTRVNQVLLDSMVRKIMPLRLRFSWGKHSYIDSLMCLYALKPEVEGSGPLLVFDDVIDAEKDQTDQSFIRINFTLGNKNARDWEFITGDNEGKTLAIMRNGRVINAPQVMGKIYGGVSQVSARNTTEAEELYAILKAGVLPFRAEIIQLEK